MRTKQKGASWAASRRLGLRYAARTFGLDDLEESSGSITGLASDIGSLGTLQERLDVKLAWNRDPSRVGVKVQYLSGSMSGLVYESDPRTVIRWFVFFPSSYLIRLLDHKDKPWIWRAVLVVLLPEMAGGQPPGGEGISNPLPYVTERCVANMLCRSRLST